jgi:hypothetical protein
VARRAAWSKLARTFESKLTGVRYGNGRFVAVGYASDLAYTSPDGSGWREQALPAAPGNGLHFGNGMFVTSRRKEPGILLSHDGASWSGPGGVDGGREIAADGVVFGADRFVAWHGSLLSVSTDGSAWQEIRILDPATDSVTEMYGHGRGFSGSLVAVEHDGAYFIGGHHGIIRSTDGVRFTPVLWR